MMKKLIRIYGLLLVFSLIVQVVIAQDTRCFNLPDGITTSDYLPKTIILKVKPQYRESCKIDGINNSKLKSVFKTLGVDNIYKKFPEKEVPEKVYNEQAQKFVDLSLIYELKYNAEISLERAINSLYITGLVEYALPHYVCKPLYDSDDPKDYKQYHLKTIKALLAWDIEKGDTDVVIGILDMGTNVYHPDLIDNVKYNYDDTIDGVDNDNDGFVDNYMGWDMGEDDNDPRSDKYTYIHGTHVAGISSASTDNGVGISGVGFKCKFLPVKICDTNYQITMGYESIVYAADHGCHVIDCSWGGVYGPGQYGQDIIDYATINRDALVVAACGNDDNERAFYPASYNYVLSVAATDTNDIKWVNSSYGINIDISAPGSDIYSTWGGATYGVSHGTSMASPVVAGCAAIVKSHYPLFSAIQVGEQLKVTTDNIDTIFANAQYAGKLGLGRVNLYRALTETNIPSVRMVQYNITDNNDGTFTKNDTLRIVGDFINYLASTTNLSVKLTSLSPYIKVIDSIAILGVISTLGRDSNNTDPFKVVIFPSIPPSHTIDFKLYFEDGTYKTFQYFSVILNIDYLDIDTNRIATTITSKGRLGYNDDIKSQGLGFIYNNSGESLMYCGGLVIGNSSTRVSDNIYGATPGNYDNDFISVVNVRRIIPTAVSDFDIYGVFSDSLAGVTRLNVTVTHRVFAWNTVEDSKYIILEYTIRNDGSSSLTNLYAGFFADWNIDNYWKNRVSFDKSNRMGFTFSTEGGTYVGIKLLTSDPIKHYAFDNDGQYHSIQIYNSDGSFSFTGDEKNQALKSINNNIKDNNTAGMAPEGNDVSDMVSTGPFNLQVGDSVKIAFALIAGDHLADIQSSAVAADKRYNPDTTSISFINNNTDKIYLGQNYPDPFSENTQIDVYLPHTELIDLSVYDIFGKKVLTIANFKLGSGQHSFMINANELESGIYYYRLTTHSISYLLTKKMILIK